MITTEDNWCTPCRVCIFFKWSHFKSNNRKITLKVKVAISTPYSCDINHPNKKRFSLFIRVLWSVSHHNCYLPFQIRFFFKRTVYYKKWHNVIYVVFYSTQFLISKNLDFSLTLAIIFVHNSLHTKFLQNNIMYMYLCVCVYVCIISLS